MSDERPIGVFDSGVGGLTVFREVMRRVPGGELEQAITYLNMADARTAEYGPEEAEGAVNDCLEKASAWQTLRTSGRP